MNYDIISIGDIVTDAFIRLQDAHVHCNINKVDCQLSVPFGAKIPYESVTVCNATGNASNVAVCASRLGLKTALVSDMGDDRIASESLSYLKEEKVSIEFVTKHRDFKSNYHYVLWYGDDRTILIKHEKYPYNLPETLPTKWLYVSSLGQNALNYTRDIERYLVAHPEVNVAFQPGTYQLRLGFDELRRLYERTQIFFCNTDEARQLLDSKEMNPANLAEMIFHHGPKNVVVTDGRNGAYLYDGHMKWFMPMYPEPSKPLERTGAGDAFSGTVTALVSQGMDIHDAMLYAPINSMSVVQKIGPQAGLLTKPEIKIWLNKAPVDYKLKRL